MDRILIIFIETLQVENFLRKVLRYNCEHLCRGR